jgi:hypothetical protein
VDEGSPHSGGIMCQVCDQGYVKAFDGSCRLCTVAMRVIDWVVVTTGVAIISLLVWCLIKWRTSDGTWLFSKVQIVVTVYQVLASFAPAFSTLPTPMLEKLAKSSVSRTSGERSLGRAGRDADKSVCRCCGPSTRTLPGPWWPSPGAEGASTTSIA